MVYNVHVIIQHQGNMKIWKKVCTTINAWYMYLNALIVVQMYMLCGWVSKMVCCARLF